MRNKTLISLLVLVLFVIFGCNTLTGVSPTATQELLPSPTAEAALPSATAALPTPTAAVAPTVTLPPPPTATLPPPPTATLPPAPTPADTPTRPAGIVPTILEIHMATQTQGWAIGTLMDAYDHILRTEDGGYTWEDVSPPLLGTATKAAAFFQGSENAWVLYTDTDIGPLTDAPSVWVTTDGGNTWGGVSLPLSGMEEFFAPGNFTFTDFSRGWLLVHVGAGMSHDYSEIFATQNGGQNWTQIADPTSPDTGGLMSLPNTALAFADANWGWVTKDNQATRPGGYLMQSTDGGLSWDEVFPPAPSELDWYADGVACRSESPVFPASQTGYLLFTCRDFANDAPPRSFFYATTDGGGTWRYTPLPASVHQLIFLTPDDGWAFGRKIFRTTDGGQTWTLVKQVHWDGQFSFVDAQHGWAVARNRDTGEIALVSTSDGGATWQIIQPIIPGE